jgi:lipopolysaccharide export system protein LptA
MTPEVISLELKALYLSKTRDYGPLRHSNAGLGCLLLSCLIIIPAIASPASEHPNSSAKTTLPVSHQVTFSSAHQTIVDPKSGVTLWTANVQSAEATTSASGALMTEMDGVDGQFYEQGKPADAFTASKVSYDDHTKSVTAHGGVTIRSLTQKETTLTCDSVVWRSANNSLIGTGHVVLHSGKFTQTGPSFTADTRLKDVVMRSTSDQRVHMIFQP